MGIRNLNGNPTTSRDLLPSIFPYEPSPSRLRVQRQLYVVVQGAANRTFRSARSVASWSTWRTIASEYVDSVVRLYTAELVWALEDGAVKIGKGSKELKDIHAEWMSRISVDTFTISLSHPRHSVDYRASARSSHSPPPSSSSRKPVETNSRSPAPAVLKHERPPIPSSSLKQSTASTKLTCCGASSDRHHSPSRCRRRQRRALFHSADLDFSTRPFSSSASRTVTRPSSGHHLTSSSHPSRPLTSSSRPPPIPYSKLFNGTSWVPIDQLPSHGRYSYESWRARVPKLPPLFPGGGGGARNANSRTKF